MDQHIQAMITKVGQLDIVHLLTNALPFLSDAERTLASFILHNPQRVTTLNSAELAAESGVSGATVFRLCRELGLSGYSELRDKIRDAVQAVGATYIAPLSVPHTDAGMSLIQSGAYTGIRVLLDACSMDQAQFEEAARAIAKARRIGICGVGHITGRMADILGRELQLLGLTCMYWSDLGFLQRAPQPFETGDVVIGLSHSGQNESVAEFLQSAAANGATTIAITNYGSSRVAQQASIALVTSFREKTVHNYNLLPRIAELLVMQMLVQLIQKELEEQKNG